MGVAGGAELCHSRFLLPHRRPALRHASLHPRYPRSHRQSHWWRVRPGELIRQYVPLFSPLRFVTWFLRYFSKSGSFVAFPTSSLTFPFTSWSLPSTLSCVLGFIILSFLLAGVV